MARAVIIGAALIENYDFVRSYLKDDDFFIFCDGGLNHLEKLQVLPNLIVGDFDSYTQEKFKVETIVLPCEKDDTDTIFAIKEAINRGFDDFLLIGVRGSRFDHTLGNVYALQMLLEKGKTGKIVDDYCEMQIVSKAATKIDSNCKYFSLIAFCGNVRGVEISGAKYPLKNAEIKSSYQYAISNQCLKNCDTFVSVKQGLLLLITVFSE